MRTRTNKRWTQREIDYIREKYPTTKRWVLAHEMGVSEVILESTIRRYGLPKKVKRWTIRDIMYLREAYPTSTIQDIANKMGISFCSAKYALEKYNVLKMRKKKKEPVNG